MKKACLYVAKIYQKNEIFDPKSRLNRDNGLEFFHRLKEQLLVHNIDLQTQDMCSLEEAELILYNEVPKSKSEVKYPEKSALLLYESEVIRPDNWDSKNHKFYKYIFTWNDDFVDGKKYIKFNFTHSGKSVFKKFSEKDNFCTLIAGNKFNYHPFELYSKRIEAIKWFEKEHPDKFEFYGVGWDHFVFKMPVLSRVLNRIKPLTKLVSDDWPLYRGAVKDKLSVLNDYKFSICYENAHSIKGYITEKIFDSMAAGCIPIYWGAPNIEMYVPKECYIDRTNYKSYEDLYEFISNMTEFEYNKTLEAIMHYLNSEQHQQFEAKFNADLVVERLVNG